MTRVGHQGYWEVRRDEHPVGFWSLIVLYGLGFAGLLVGGMAHRAGWLIL